MYEIQLAPLDCGTTVQHLIDSDPIFATKQDHLLADCANDDDHAHAKTVP